MFTGIISDVTSMKVSEESKDGLVLTFKKPSGWDDLKIGESIATNGVCLTITALRPTEYDCFVMPETLEKTSFGSSLPTEVNLERALQIGDRLDGHFVQGHVDGIGTVTNIDTKDGYRITISFDPPCRKYVIYKGSITIDGVALTVVAVEDATLEVAIIPHTLEHTTLHNLQKGDPVNLEFDVIGKYVLNSAASAR
jgi:riboflavin synthase